MLTIFSSTVVYNVTKKQLKSVSHAALVHLQTDEEP